MPWCRRTWSPERSGLPPGTTCTQASKRLQTRPADSGATSQLPRCTASRSRPRRLTPTRLPALHDLGLVIVHLHAAHGGAGAAGLHHHRVAGADLAAPQRARDHRADALEREHPVDRQAGGAAAPARRDVLGGALQSGEQLGRAAPVAGAHGDDLAAGVGRLREELAHVLLRHLQQLLVHEVGLGQRHHAALHAEQLDDRHVLHGLRHHAVVGGDHQQEEVDAGGAGHHGAHEALVAGDVHDAQAAAPRQLQLGVAELDGDAPLLLLAQAVGVLAGEERDERRLAVVDVPGRAEGQRDGGIPGRVGRVGCARHRTPVRRAPPARRRPARPARRRARRAGRRAGGRRAGGTRRRARRAAARRRARRRRRRRSRPRRRWAPR